MREFFAYKVDYWLSRHLGEYREISVEQYQHLLDEAQAKAEHDAKYRAFKTYAKKWRRFSDTVQNLTSSKLYRLYAEWMGDFPFRQEHFDSFIYPR